MDTAAERVTVKELKETGRVEALTDGIFAIAMTLLVLNIAVPTLKDNQSLFDALARNWTAYFAFAVGFMTLLVCWINHHYMFELICKLDGPLLLLNGFKLLVVSFTPFATAVLAKYVWTGSEQEAVSFYTADFFLMGLSMTLLFCYAEHSGHLVRMSARKRAAATRLYIFASILSGLIFALSFVSVYASLVLFCVMFAVFVFPKGMAHAMARRDGWFGRLVAAAGEVEAEAFEEARERLSI